MPCPQRRRRSAAFGWAAGWALVAVAAPASGGSLIFADDFESGDTRWWAPCLPPGSAITLGSPTYPLPLAFDPEHEIFAHIKATGAGDPPVEGTFSYGPETVSPPPPFVCEIDGIAQNCTDLDYSLAGLAEGGHQLVVAGTRCGANPVVSLLSFFVDSSPPYLAATPAVLVDSDTASASVELAIADAITNIETIDCLLDFDANGVNPDILAADGDPGNDFDALLTTCNAFGLGFTPMRPAPNESMPRSMVGTLHISELAPGLHKLWIRATDFWGHAATTAVEFAMDAGDVDAGRFGHVVAIGHDFSDLSPDVGTLVGNGVLLSGSQPFLRNLRVLGLDLGNVDAEGIVKIPMLDAIAARFDSIGETVFDYAEWPGDAAQADEGLRARLLGRDVLLIYDQNDPARAAQIGTKAPWLDVLRTFVERGGIVVVLDGLVGDEPSGTVRILGNAETWNQPGPPAGADPLDEDVNVLDSGALLPKFEIGAMVELVCRSDSPIAVDVGYVGAEPQTYEVPGGTVLLLQDPVANEIFVAPQSGTYHPVVMDKKFPVRTDTGPVRLVAKGLDPLGEVVPRDAHAFALFSAPSGEVEAVCRLRADGGAAHDLSAGGTVSVASAKDAPGVRPEGCCPFGGILELESVFGVELFETISVGRTVAPPKWSFGSIEIEVPRYPDLASAANVVYSLSNGCARATAAQTTAGTHPIVTIPEVPTDECVFGSDMSFLVDVRDLATGEVLAYAALANVPFAGGVDCHGTFPFDGWCAQASDWPVVSLAPATQWAAPQSPRLFVNYGGPAFAPAAGLEAVQVLARDAASGVGFEEGLGLDPTSELYFVPKVPNPFADTLRLNGLVYTSFGSASGPFSLTARATDLALGPAGLDDTTPTLPRAEFLPRILGYGTGGSVASPSVSWFPTGSLAGAAALGGLGTLDYTASDSCEDPRCPVSGSCGAASWDGSWTFVVPASAPSVTMPALPGELYCWQPIAGGPALRSLAFVDLDLPPFPITDDLFRQQSWAVFDLAGNALRTRVLGPDCIARMTSVCTEASFCSPRETPDSPDPAQRIFPGCYSPPEVEDLLCF
jgi:hypothetical protein